jgi:SAM-dependent methyltransferase
VKKEYEDQYHRLEESHWWFVGRRHLVRKLVLQATTNPSSHILEIGCSGGPLMQQLATDGYKHVTGIDISKDGVALCHQRGLTDAHVMDAQKLDLPNSHFDVITASDVLEHLPDAPKALAEWYRVLKPGGNLIVFVPAFQFLWSEHDEVNLHFQRYTKAGLSRMISEAGFSIVRASYWNFCLFWPVALVRLLRRVLPKSEVSGGDIKPSAKIVNCLLAALLRSENWLILKGLNFPTGVSAMVIARKLANQQPTSS